MMENRPPSPYFPVFGTQFAPQLHQALMQGKATLIIIIDKKICLFDNFVRINNIKEELFLFLRA